MSKARTIRTSALDRHYVRRRTIARSACSRVIELIAFCIGIIVIHGSEMKTFIFSLARMGFAALLLWLFAIEALHARLLNGYGGQIASNKQSLENLRMMLLGSDSLSPDQRRQLKSKIAALVDFISLYEITEEAIDQLRTVSPKIFLASDAVRDKRGRRTDIYVKLVHKERSRLPLEGANFLWQHANDKDLSVSEFGNRTASIEVWINCNAVLLLSHELGHVIYIVPNLATYVDFYKSAYARVGDITYVGHKYQDPSGKSADNFMMQFRNDLREYRRLGGVKLESPLSRLVAIRKQLRTETVGWGNVATRKKPLAQLDKR